MRHLFAALALTLAACGGDNASSYDDEIAQVLEGAECPDHRKACSDWGEASCELGDALCWGAAARCTREAGALDQAECSLRPDVEAYAECAAQKFECFGSAQNEAARQACIASSVLDCSTGG